MAASGPMRMVREGRIGGYLGICQEKGGCRQGAGRRAGPADMRMIFPD